HHTASEIACCCNPLRSELALEQDVPRIRVRSREIVGRCDELPPRRERHVLLNRVWKGIATGIAKPRVGKTALRTCDGRASSPRIRTRLIFPRDARDVGVTERVRRATRCFAGTRRIPGESDSRIKLLPATVGRGFPGKAGVAREVKTCRSVDEHRAFDASEKTIHIEDRNLTVRYALWQERLPSQPVIEGETLRRFACIREIQVHR